MGTRKVSDPTIASYLEHSFSKIHFRGICIENDIVQLYGDVTYPALKTVLEINNKFGMN